MINEEPNRTSGRNSDDPNGNRVSMHIRMRPSVKDRLKSLSNQTGRTMIELLESGVLVQESQAEFLVSPSNDLRIPSKAEFENFLEQNAPKSKKTGRVNGGNSTNDLVLSCYQETNDFVFPHVLKLYVFKGATIADCTYGRGVFWRNVDVNDYTIHFSDLKKAGLPKGVKGGIDARRLPYGDGTLDAVVFDPPYMHSPGGTAHNGHQNFEAYYANNVGEDKVVTAEILKQTNGRPPKYHEAVLDLYFRAAKEAWRVLKCDGVYIVKCQDEVCANRNRFTHVELMNEFQKYGFICKDLFVVMRTNKPGVSRLKSNQAHARKNHSYFLVFVKPRPKINYDTNKSRNSMKNRPNG